MPGDLPIYETPLHPTIQLASLSLSTGETVIYDPSETGTPTYVMSTVAFDTYDVR